MEIWDKVISESIQVQVGAYVTSYGRLMLLDALRKQAKKGKVYYCDTDSIVCQAKMDQDMVDPYALSKWDCEAELYSGIFLQPKVYTEITSKGKTTIKFKGISKKRQCELTYSYYEELYSMIERGDKFKFEVEKGYQRLPSLHVAQKSNGKIDPNTLVTINKNMNLKAKQKRQMDYKGNSTKPYFFNSLEEFNNFTFSEFKNPPDGPNLFGG